MRLRAPTSQQKVELVNAFFQYAGGYIASRQALRYHGPIAPEFPLSPKPRQRRRSNQDDMTIPTTPIRRFVTSQSE